MLSHYFESTARIQAIRNNLSGSLLEEFSDYLFESGYAEISARRHIRSAEHLVYWASKSGLSINELNDLALARFSDHLTQCHCGQYSRAKPVNILTGARLFLKRVHRVDTLAVREPEPADPQPALLRAFCEWMREQRGTSEPTLYNYSLPIRELIHRLGGDPKNFDARSLRQFVLEQNQCSGWAKTKHCTTALRMFLRFLIAEGLCHPGLLGAIPMLAHWRLASLPKYLPPEDVERIIESCDTSSPVGKRNRAILLLLARLALRAGDIVQMRLQDVDWKDAWIQVSGKSLRQTRLPLTREVGQAIATYLQEGRPAGHSDTLFLRSRAPFRALATHAAVSALVARAMDRAEITRPSRGAAHLLRHSIATEMLRHGASLQEISDLLRHRNIETTQIYAKVDVEALRQIAQPWSEVPSC
jgi:site-specific recombinase XerD